MANPTSNFNWQMPTNTDLVKDLPADFEVFGQAVDTAMADLLGGTTGQILAKNSNTNMDFVWITNDVGDITAVNVTSPITGGGSSGAVTIGIDDGTTAQKGAVQLEDSTSSTSTTKAATPNSVKSAYDLANAAIPKSLIDANGDLILGTADNTAGRLAIGTSGYVLKSDGSTAAWAIDPTTDVVTTAGDLIYGTAADTVARLGIGTAGQVLKVNSGATAPEWGAAAAGALTLVSATTFSSVNAHSVNSCFSSTYRYYRILCDFTEAVTANRTLNFRLRASGSDTTTTYTDVMGIMYNTNFDVATGGSGEVFLGDVGAGTVLGHLEMTIFNPNGAAPTGYSHTLNSIKNTSLQGQIGSGVQTASTAFDGFTLYLSSENMTGTIKVYGYSN